MAITRTKSGAIVIEGKEDINLFALMATKGAVSIYVRTGFKPARNFPTVKALRVRWGITARTYKDALDQLTQLEIEARRKREQQT